MRKILSFIICIALIICAVPMCGVSVFASDEDYYTYYISYDEAIITHVREDISGDIVIPATLDGYPVTIIDNYAFEGCYAITGVTFPKTIKRVGYYAFEDCINITKVNTTDISAWSSINFETQSSNPIYYAQSICLNGEVVTDLVIAEGNTGVGKYAFYNCKSLESVTFPSSMALIGAQAFKNCDSLTRVTISPDMQFIENDAFGGCSKLERVDISDLAAWCNINFEYSDANPLTYAGNLYLNDSLITDLVIPEGVTHIADCAFSGGTSIKSVNIHKNVDSVGNYAFYKCSSLEEIVIPNGVDYLGYYAFADCASLQSAVLPDDLTVIDGHTFENCQALESIDIPETVTEIGYAAFSGCESLTEIAIPASVISIDDYAFYDCTALTRVDITDLTAWCNIEFKFSYVNPLYYAGNLYLNGSLVTDLVIPHGITKINENAFVGCTSIVSASIPNSVGIIEYDAFMYCDSLKEITIPNSVTDIGSNAFYDCSSLEKIPIPESVESIGSNAFGGCYGLKGVYITDVAAWCNIEFDDWNGNASNPILLCNKLYLNGDLVTDLIIPEGVKSIGKLAFYGGESIENVYVPDTVTKIGRDAFLGTAWYENQPDGIVYAGKVAYKYKGETSPTVITIKNDTVGIASNAFEGCYNVKNITIPNSVEYVGAMAFSGCAELESIVIGESVTIIDEYAFFGCNTLADITLGKGVESIGYGAFGAYTAIENVYYKGSLLNKYNIAIDSYNDSLNNAKWHYDACTGAADHSYDGVCDEKCNGCGVEREAQEHTFGENGICRVCGYVPYVIGDLDGDLKTSTTDLAIIKLFLAGTSNLNETGKLAGDINDDGEIDTSDLAALKLKLAGI